MVVMNIDLSAWRNAKRIESPSKLVHLNGGTRSEVI